MRIAVALLVGLAASVSSAFAALPAASVWEIRTTGSDNSGGCYVAGSTGTDYSQQDAAQFSGTNLTVDATTNTIVTSAAHTFASTDVGNCVHITAGTGWTLGFYQIVSVSAGAATLDRSPAAVSTAGGTWAEGGALATVATATANVTASNRIWVRAGTYTVSSTTSFPTGVSIHWTTTSPPSRLSGYSTTRGDGGQPTFTASGSGITIFNITSDSWIIEHVILNCASQATSTGISFNGNGSSGVLRYAKVMGCITRAVQMQTGNKLEFSEITGNSGVVNLAYASGGYTVLAYGNFIHDNTGTAVIASNASVIEDNIIANNTGASSDGISLNGAQIRVTHNTITGSGRDAINTTFTLYTQNYVKRNILANSGAWGYVGATGVGRPADPDWDGNAYYNNASGNRSNLDDTTTNPQNNVVAYTNSADVILTASPFTNPASNDFSLNTVSGGGAAIRGLASSSIPGISTPSYRDFGALQSAPTVTNVSCGTSGTAFVQ